MPSLAYVHPSPNSFLSLSILGKSLNIMSWSNAWILALFLALLCLAKMGAGYTMHMHMYALSLYPSQILSTSTTTTLP
jgi:hypothetical protein